MSLQVQYRPKSFKTFIGNEHVIESLSAILQREQPPAAFLFTGMGGTGKTTIGRIVARMLKCKKTGFKELNSADDRGIDGIRKIINGMKYAPLDGGKKVILLDEAHMLTKPSQEALLKALEEPPKHIHFIVCTTNPETLKQTFKRRCHAYELEPLKNSDLQKLLKRVLRKEGRIDAVSSEVRDKISELADGSAGQALKLLDQVIDMDDTERAINTLQSAGTSESEVIDICRTLCHYNMPEKTKWAKIKKMLKVYKGDGESARRPIAGYLSAILLNNGGDDVAYMLENFTEKNFFDSGKAGLVLACYKSVFIGEN
ncbi:MAG: hypothetical protein DRQ49_19750 [Gammaproteobacteria bacterium]|nr:MAG: hypothetical protein DRQ49_19750 [Gammaproteobacteria bacterium]